MMNLTLWLKQGKITAINYLDTSILYDFYVRGPRTTKVRTFCNQNQQVIAISTWTETEFYGALSRRIRDGTIPLQAAETLAKKLKSHLTQGLYQRLAVEADYVSSAAALTRRFALTVKSPDALHLALVQHKGHTLVTSDKTMVTVAQQLSIPVTHIET